MSAHHLRPSKNTAKHPLPKRNREDAMLRRMGSLIRNQQHLEAELAKFPPYYRAAFLEKLRPYLKFEPSEKA